MANIKYFGFAKSSSSAPIYALCQQDEIEDELKIEATKVLNQLKKLNLRPEQRQKINTVNGCWFCKKDNNNILYIALCNPTYPQRHIYAAIHKLRQHLAKLGSYESEPDSSLKMHAKSTVKQICSTYQNIKNTDKVARASSNLQEIRVSVADSTRKMINNQVQLEDLERKSQTLKGQANQFSQSANELERIMYLRNCKLKIIIVVIIVCLVVYIVVPIIMKVTNKD